MNKQDITQRENIIELLKQGPVSFMSVANKLGKPLKELMDDFEQINQSFALKTDFAKCKKCEYEFKEDKRFHTPSKCPSCHSEWIEGQKFWIDE